MQNAAPGRIDQPQDTDPTWLHIAFSQLGVAEVSGAGDNPRIVEYFGATTLGPKHDETPWCSAFVNWCMRRAGLVGTGGANARSWLGWGTAIQLPQRGCVAVYRRTGPGKAHDDRFGHVAFWLGGTDLHDVCLGGNQADPRSGGRVSIAPRARALLLGYRIP